MTDDGRTSVMFLYLSFSEDLTVFIEHCSTVWRETDLPHLRGQDEMDVKNW